jgi:hypothetical protein
MIAKLQELARISEHIENHIESLTRMGFPETAQALELVRAELDDRVYAIGTVLLQSKDEDIAQTWH